MEYKRAYNNDENDENDKNDENVFSLESDAMMKKLERASKLQLKTFYGPRKYHFNLKF